MNLYQANKQWATRPDDEKFKTVEELYNATKAYAGTAREKIVPISDVRVENVDGDVQLVGRKNVPAKFTHYSFGQLASRLDFKASELRKLPATLTSQVLNHLLANRVNNDDNPNVNLLIHENGTSLLRSFTSEMYGRIWNYEVAEKVLGLKPYGWNPAVPDGVVEYDNPPIYASDHDMFVFLANDNYTIKEEGNPDGLKRGTIVRNSEVGDGLLEIIHFLYRRMCRNHIIWGASKLNKIQVRHVGDARHRFNYEWRHYEAQIRQFVESSSTEQESKIARAKTVYLGTDKDAVLDKLFEQKSLRLTRKTLEAAYDAVNVEQDGNPRTIWGIVQGLTRYSQESTFADERTAIDKAAGKLMEANF